MPIRDACWFLTGLLVTLGVRRIFGPISGDVLHRTEGAFSMILALAIITMVRRMLDDINEEKKKS